MSAKTGARRGERVPAASLPVARIVVDVPLAHLDRPFDYSVPSELDSAAVPGCRVRVRFAGQLVDGYLLERAESSEYGKKLAFIEKVVSPEPVLTPEIAALARAVADRYAGNMMDVLRLAIPPRHARAEAAASPEPPPLPQVPAWVGKHSPDAEPVEPAATETPADASAAPAEVPAEDKASDAAHAVLPERSQLPPVPADAWSRYPRGPKYLEALREGRPAHAVWQALPSEDWPARLAEAAAAVASTGKGVIIVVPDHRDLARVAEACGGLIEGVVTLSADLGPSERYKRWLAVRRGVARVVVGTRATAFAPIKDPGLLVVWDDGDDLHVEQRSPYPNVRDVLVQRAHMSGAALLIGGFARTAEAQLLVETGWAHEIVASRETLRAIAPRVVSVGDNEWQDVKDSAARTARLPSIAFDAARFALTDSPVLIQVPRRGYVPALACAQCRGPARCRRCAGPLALPGGMEDGSPKPAYCRWCAATEAGFRCPTCGSRRLRGQIIGARRTAEELGRAFPGFPVRTSGADEVLTKVPGRPSLVVATPGAEPVAEGGYGAVLLLDGWALLGRADLRASEEALRRWMTAAGLVRPGNGRVVVIADSSLTPVQALVRWDPVWHASTELAARTELGFPPAVRMATVDGTPDAVNALLDELRLPPTGEVLGPVPLGDDETRERALVRVARSEGRQLAAVLAEAQAVRTARKEQELVRIKLDPLEVL
ncbi:primosomal protein N' [Lentzea sp. BCCO 10_0856]|uniref:Probable replication restart protein PriA n=1 Tax=Lentzea miocenica TaxID=3095431 RepID=A0ABU4T0E6_9PSEU|nr:primosomal protein N' [Lentzea sp. BCCO 10_0856]MDX8031539.1 primosomal protein N' [Lentzea sp. BCCO 10_0856]